MLKGIGLGPSQVCILSCKDSWVLKCLINRAHLFMYIDFIKMIFLWMDSFKCTHKIMDKIDNTASRQNGALKPQILVVWIYFILSVWIKFQFFSVYLNYPIN